MYRIKDKPGQLIGNANSKPDIATDLSALWRWEIAMGSEAYVVPEKAAQNTASIALLRKTTNYIRQPKTRNWLVISSSTTKNGQDIIQDMGIPRKPHTPLPFLHVFPVKV